jgi:hypothetical protein
MGQFAALRPSDRFHRLTKICGAHGAQLAHKPCVAPSQKRKGQCVMKLAKIAATALALAVALPTFANAATHYRYYTGYHGGGNTAAAAHFQDQFKNTY